MYRFLFPLAALTRLGRCPSPTCACGAHIECGPARFRRFLASRRTRHRTWRACHQSCRRRNCRFALRFWCVALGVCLPCACTCIVVRFNSVRDAQKILPMPREESHDDANTVTGTPANPGCVTGIARVLHDPSQWGRVKKGDIAVIQSTSSSFNILLPLLGAIVTDYGGTLTHAAICAREFGIPAVTACWDATTRIRDGATITVDGAAGKVFIVK